MSVADPPAEVNVIGVPTVPVRVVFDTVSVASAATGASPRMTGAPDSASPELPHPARSRTAHAMAAPAALLFVERGLDAPKRLSRALIVGRASPGQWPIIVLVTDTLWGGGCGHYRVNTVHLKKFCPGLRWFVIFQVVGACPPGRPTPCCTASTDDIRVHLLLDHPHLPDREQRRLARAVGELALRPGSVGEPPEDRFPLRHRRHGFARQVSPADRLSRPDSYEERP